MLSPNLNRFFEQGGEQPATVAFALTGVILLFVAQAWIVRSLRHQSRIFSPGFPQFGRLNAGG
jgi:flagellar biogenesis protein FliO